MKANTTTAMSLRKISPDGSRLLFLRTNEDQDDVYTYDLMVASEEGADPASIVRRVFERRRWRDFRGLPNVVSRRSIDLLPGDDLPKVHAHDPVVRVNTSGSARLVLASRRVNYKELKYVNGQVRSRDAALYTRAWTPPPTGPGPGST